MQKFDLKSNEYIAIRCLPNCGPIFGNNDLVVDKDFQKGKISKTKNSSFLIKNFKDILADKEEKGNFNIKQVEIFSIIY